MHQSNYNKSLVNYSYLTNKKHNGACIDVLGIVAVLIKIPSTVNPYCDIYLSVMAHKNNNDMHG